MDPITAVSIGAKLKSFFSSKWFWAVLLLISVAGGTYWYLDQSKDEAVATAVKGADTAATIQSHEAKEEVEARTAPIETQYIIKREQTIKDYTNVRNQAAAAPADERNAQAPRLIIDTLNELDRLYGAREQPSGVPDSDAPVG